MVGLAVVSRDTSTSCCLQPPAEGLSTKEILRDFYLANCLTAKRSSARRNQRTAAEFLRAYRITDVTEITPGIVQDYLIDLMTAGRAPKTLRNHHGAICCFLDYCVRSGLAEKNPAKGVPLPPKEEIMPIFLTPPEIDQTLDIAREHGIYGEVATAIYTGLRMTELRNLAWV